MELRHLRYFFETANQMSFTRAAERLHIAQPSLSKQIRDLEEELKVTLFERGPHYMELTPEGMMLQQYAEQILELADRAAESVTEAGQGLNGTISLSTVEGNTLRSVSHWVAKFSRLYPAVSFAVWTGTSDEIINRLRNGLCDIGVAQDMRNAAGICRELLFKERWTAMIPRDNPLAQAEGDTVDTMELFPYELMIPLRPDRLEQVNGWYESLGRKPRIRCRYSNALIAYELVREGMGIAVWPGDAGALADAQTAPRVRIKAISNPSLSASFAMLTPESRPLSNVTREFMQFIREEALHISGQIRHNNQ